MDSTVLPLPAAAGADAPGWEAAEPWRDAHLALAFLPPGDDLEARLHSLGERFPRALVAGCEAVTQFHDDRLAAGGTVHLLRFTARGDAEALVLHAGGAGADGGPGKGPGTGFDDHAVDRLAARLAAGDPALLLADGLACPAEELLARLRRALDRRRGRRPTAAEPAPPPVAGGLGSMPEPPVGAGARVFLDGRVVPAGCVAVVFAGVEADVQVMCGWSAASPVYEVTRAEGRVLWEIAGEPAAEWFGRLFSVGEGAGPAGVAPLPEMAHRFPLVLAGPHSSRQGVYRSMRSFDEPPGAVTFWGELETGDHVRLAIGDRVSLVDRAGELSPAADAAPPEAAVLFSCVGREEVLAEAAGDEVAAVHGALGRVPLSGFFSFGEIGPTPSAGPAFYNHTAILVLLAERSATPRGGER